MRRGFTVARWLIGFFAVTSGLYKVGFGQADVEIFAQLGLSAWQTAVFGALQLLCGLALIRPESRRAGAVGLVVCNTVATCALFASAIQPFGWVSWLFVALAASPLFDPDGV